MLFINAIELINCAIKNDLLVQNPENKNEIAVYRSEGEKYPEGWYWTNIHTSASELANDQAGQQIILEKLKELGVEPELTDWSKMTEEIDKIVNT